jgi:hypothetical protein
MKYEIKINPFWVALIITAALILDPGWLYALKLRQDISNNNLRYSEEIDRLNDEIELTNNDIAQRDITVDELKTQIDQLRLKIRSLESNQMSVTNNPSGFVCLSEQTIQEIRNDPRHILAAFESCKYELRNQLGLQFKALDENDLRIIFSTIIAYNLAPYGDSSAVEFEEILNENRLQCSNYALALGYFDQLLNTDENNRETRYIGWMGGYIGNHTQVISINKDNGVNLLLDPTIGVIALASYDEIASGKKVSENNLLDFSYRFGSKALHDKIILALLNGEYRPADILYVFDSIDKFLNTARHDYIMTPGGEAYRKYLETQQ